MRRATWSLVVLFVFGCGTEESTSTSEPSNEVAAVEETVVDESVAEDEPAPVVTTELTAEAVTAARAASREALERDDHGADAAARLELVSAYVRWAEGHPSEDECLPTEDPNEPPPGERRVARDVTNARWMARREARDELSCVEERGGDDERLGELRADLERLGAEAAARCEERGLRPMAGRVAVISTIGVATSPCPTRTGLGGLFAPSSAIDRVLGIREEAAAGSAAALDALFAPPE